MNYLLIYLSIGIVVSLLIAIAHVAQPSGAPEALGKRVMMNALLFLTLAWPVSVMAVLYGALSRDST